MLMLAQAEPAPQAGLRLAQGWSYHNGWCRHWLYVAGGALTRATHRHTWGRLWLRIDSGVGDQRAQVSSGNTAVLFLGAFRAGVPMLYYGCLVGAACMPDREL